MFDSESTKLLQSAPEIPGVNPKDLPRLFTEIFSELITTRVRAERADQNSASLKRLVEIANSYEIITAVSTNHPDRKAAAFVAGTAYQILAKSIGNLHDESDMTFTRDHISGHVAASLLFLISQQYPDAKEAIRYFRIIRDNQVLHVQMLSESLVDLILENFSLIIERAKRRREIEKFGSPTLLDLATQELYQLILSGVEMLSREVLGISDPEFTMDSGTIFDNVIALSARSFTIPGLDQSYISTYPGPAHLATLLRNLGSSMRKAAILLLPTPNGADESMWREWLQHRALQKPILWANHKTAIDSGFHQPGSSSVVVLPTGAGKTTLSEFKIAATLSSGKNVIFLAPTNALVDQLKSDLEKSLPLTLFAENQDIDEGSSWIVNPNLSVLEVMTPEKCLAILNFNAEIFSNVGLVVFDECHSLSSEAGSFRRSLDGMLVVISLLNVVPHTDFLFLSAMLKEPARFAEWISSQTNRSCVLVDMLWKPSRQARGVVIYEGEELQSAISSTYTEQQKSDADRSRKKGKVSKSIQTAAARHLQVTPFALFGLVHNWHPDRPEDIRIGKLSNQKIQLDGKLSPTRRVIPAASGNEVARNIAIAAANSNLKTIVFLNNANWTFSSSKQTEGSITSNVTYNSHEQRLLLAIESEFGQIECSMLYNLLHAVPHNSNLISFERHLAESLFKRDDGASIIYATTTLSQGMNLPAQIAILSADERTNLDGPIPFQEPMKAHELLNAAGRAGRAGYLANGMVILVPRTVLTFAGDEPDRNAKEILKSIVPEDERCVTMIDPLQKALDMIQADEVKHIDVEYLFNRLSANADQSVNVFFQRSFGGFIAIQEERGAQFNEKVEQFKAALE